MIYVKSILAGLAAVVGITICMIFAVAIDWWQFLSGDRIDFAGGTTIIIAAIVGCMVALLSFALGFRWEFRRLTHPK